MIMINLFSDMQPVAVSTQCVNDFGDLVHVSCNEHGYTLQEVDRITVNLGTLLTAFEFADEGK
jgi:hypothetical protein